MLPARDEEVGGGHPTAELLARRALRRHLSDEDAIAWALGLMQDGPPHPNLAALAGLCFPFNHFEVEELLLRAFAELGLPVPSLDEAYRSALSESCKAILAGARPLPEVCEELAAAYQVDPSRRSLQPFSLLWLGQQELETEGDQPCYEGLTLASFDDLLRAEARQMLAALSAPEADPSC